MDTAEALSRRRRLLVLTAAVGFLIWQGSLAARGTVHPSVHLVVDLLALLTFLGGLVGSLRTGHSVRGTGTERALNDEMAQRNRLVALATGFWAMLGASAGVFVADELLGLNAGAAAQAILTVGVITALLRFALLEGLMEHDED